MTTMVLRCQYRGGKRTVVKDLTGNSTLEHLQEKIWLLTDVPPHAQRILKGFPPQEVNCKTKSTDLSSLGIRTGDTLIVELNKMAPRVLSNNLIAERCHSLPMSRKIVPADNSCLFASISYVITGDVSMGTDLRQLIAKNVSNDPTTYTEAFLGKSNSDYCSWILNPDNWGGAIELSVLSKHYEVEMCVVDTETERIDRFGEDGKYKNRVFLIYDGIHYDPLGVHDNTLPLQTVFPCTEENRLIEAISLAREAKKNRKYTNVAKFTLRCLACNTSLTGQTEAQQHAVTTGHTNFGEV